MLHFSTPLEAAHWLKQRSSGSLQSDSRQLGVGDAFVAWPGGLSDARQYVAPAIAQGAAACLVEHDGVGAFDWPSDAVVTYDGLKSDAGVIAAEFFQNPSQALAVVAITGTNGKTSSAWWLAQALSALPDNYALPCGLVGTLGVGCPPAAGQACGAEAIGLVATGFTTPDPVMLQKTLRQFVDAGLKACAMEASSIGIEEHRLNGTQIRVAVFTNFTQDHLDYHGDMQSYWDSKRKLFAWPGLQHAVVNVDDPQGAVLASTLQALGQDVWTTSVVSDARIRAQSIGYTEQGLRFEVCEDGVAHAITTQMIGTYNVSNLLGVIAVMRCLGVPLPQAVAVCADLRPVPGRMECLTLPGAPLVAVDYAHTPDAIGKALDALRSLASQRGGKLWCVFGCGGDRDNAKRPMMGALAAQKADRVVVTSDNPRGEKPEAIIAQVLLGIAKSVDVQVQADRALAIAQTIAQADAQDVVLLAGKGHETTQEVAGVKTAFFDRAHAHAAMQLRAQGEAA
ncbi:MAG: UDP-N-acetylmuramoyl-L-alanyl-D-glutamate--2,6-diaminopimelate ligase [Burkholderiales bacterium PBB3]|nr:MAG: UDP-N-acetylmuramoyl-L-alanyl-D-glutamate--2,6-diaminopimelate ligase [Burkholderiales bacterium PBB3]